MAKARVGLYSLQGETLTRSHKFCPKCGAGIFLAEHSDRRSCGRCGYMESKPKDSAPVAAPAPKPAVKAAKPKAPKAPPAAAPAPPAAAPAAPKPPK